VAALNGKMYLVGGFNHAGYCLNDVWSSADGATWVQELANTTTPGAQQFAGRCDHGLVAFNNELWLTGGFDSAMKDSNEVWHSADGKVWTLVTPAPAWLPRSGHTSVVFQNKIWVLGGYGENAQGYNTNFNDVFASTDGAAWTPVTTSAEWGGRRGHVTLVHDGGTGAELWVLGGMSGGIMMPTFNDEVWHSADGATWTQIVPDFGFYARNSHSGESFAGQMWIMAGISDVHNSVATSTDGTTWDEVTTSAPWAARLDAATVVFNNRMWIMGGTYVTTQSVYYNDVWATP
jgi:N-acetylneuraminic acid mutarotase